MNQGLYPCGVTSSMFAPRAIAAKLSIREITEGSLISREDGRIVGVETYLGQISRVNVIATVVDRFEATSPSDSEAGRGFATITIDDGTGALRVKMWGETTQQLAEIQVGDLVLVIGRVRSFQNETYLNGEVIRRLDDPNWETVRLLELTHSRVTPRMLKEQIESSPAGPAKEETTADSPRQVELEPGVWQTAAEAFEKQAPTEEGETPIVSAIVRRIVLQTIEKHDQEGGARFEQILEATSGTSEEEVEQVLIDLLSEGLVYEPDIHRYKKS